MFEEQPVELKTMIVMVVGIFASFVTFSMPVLQYSDLSLVGLFGLFSGICVVGIYAELQKPTRYKSWYFWTALTVASFALVGLAWMMQEGIQNYRANQERCAAVQRDMLSAQPRRSDGPDIFQALGCRPQGEFPFELPKARPQQQ